MPHAHGLQPKILFSVINPLHVCKLFVEEPLPSESLEPIYQKSIAIRYFQILFISYRWCELVI